MGRGQGSGKGSYAGRGIKGQKSRSGSNKMRPASKAARCRSTCGSASCGARRRRTRCPSARTAPTTAPVNVRDLDRFDAGASHARGPRRGGLIQNTKIDVKILGTGEISKKLTVSVHRFSATAREKIEAAGGTVELMRHRGEEDEDQDAGARTRQPRRTSEEPPPAGAARSRRSLDVLLARQRMARPRVAQARALHRGDPVAVPARLVAAGPGRRLAAIEDYFNAPAAAILNLLNLFSGTALSRFSLFALGIMPYVTASIIMQLLTVVIPTLERLQKEGEAGYAKINQYTRYLTVVLAAAQATGYAFLFKRQGALPNVNAGQLVIIVSRSPPARRCSCGSAS